MYSNRDYEIFKPICNRIRKYPALQVVHWCIDQIWVAEEGQPRAYDHYPPWVLLWLAKWTLMYGDLSGGHAGRRIDDSEFRRLFSKIYELWNKLDAEGVEARSDEGKWFTYFRKKTFQQFPFQESIYSTRLARQSLMFGNLPQDNPLGPEFLNRVGLSIEHFIELVFSLVAAIFLQRKRFVTEAWFEPLVGNYPQGTISRFLQALSKDFEGIRGYLISERCKHSPELKYEYAEMPPLKRYPLLCEDHRYYCYSPILLYKALEHYMFDTLRSYDAQYFGNCFGLTIFERYVARAISYAELPVISENQIRHEFHGLGKVIDFIVVDDDVNIFIDAKGVEATYIGEVSENPAHIIQRVRSSVIDGIQQSYNLVRRLAQVQQIDGVQLGQSNERYLLIITYKDLVLGSGRNFHDYFAAHELDQIVAREGGNEWIPFENMYFISVEDLEILMWAIHAARTGMAEFLRRAVDADSTAIFQDRKIIFRQHLQSILGNLDLPAYLHKEYTRITARARSRFN